MAKILLIEDDPDQCEQYAIYLRSPDGGSHEVYEAKSATQAVDLVTKNSYDLILLDIMLAYAPEDRNNKDINDYEVDYGRKMGLYVYNRIRQLSEPPSIALVTVVDDLSVLSEFPDVVGYMGKYFPLDKLGDNVLKWLNQA